MVKGRRPAEETGGGGQTTRRWMTNRIQSGDDGSKSLEGALNRGVMAGDQATAREAPHGGYDEGRSHDGG